MGHTQSILAPANLAPLMHLPPMDGQSWDSMDKRMNSFVGFKIENKQVLKKIIQIQDQLKLFDSNYEHHLTNPQDLHVTLCALQTTTNNQSLINKLLRETFDCKTIRDALRKDDTLRSDQCMLSKE